MFYGRKCKIFKAVMPIKSYHKKLNFVKNFNNIERFVAVFAKEFANQKDKRLTPIDLVVYGLFFNFTINFRLNCLPVK